MVPRPAVPTSGSTNSQGDGGSCTFRPRGMKRVVRGPGLGHGDSQLGREAMVAEIVVKKSQKLCEGSVVEEMAHAARLRGAHLLESAR